MAGRQIRQDLVTGLDVKFGRTKVETETLTFAWVIDNFMTAIKDKKTTHFLSPLFDNSPRFTQKWQVIFRPSKTQQDHSSVHLFLRELDPEYQPETNYITARFQISLVDCDGNQTHCLGGRDSEPIQFHKGSFGGFEHWLNVNALNAEPNRYLPHGKLAIRAQIWIEGSSKQTLCTGRRLLWSPRPEVEQDQMAVDFGNLLQSEVFSDVSILIGFTTIRAHKCVLAARSKVFAAMFADETSLETVESLVRIEDVHVDAIKAMLEFIYTGKVAPDFLKERAADILVIAEKYDIKGLKQLAEYSLGNQVSVNNAMEILRLAGLHGWESLKLHVLEFLKRHRPEVVKSALSQDFVQANPETVIAFLISQLSL